MPVYSYKCNKCGYEFDLLVGVGKGEVQYKCPKCGNEDLKRILSAPARVDVKEGSSTSSSSVNSTCPTCSSGVCNL